MDGVVKTYFRCGILYSIDRKSGYRRNIQLLRNFIMYTIHSGECNISNFNLYLSHISVGVFWHDEWIVELSNALSSSYVHCICQSRRQSWITHTPSAPIHSNPCLNSCDTFVTPVISVCCASSRLGHYRTGWPSRRTNPWWALVAMPTNRQTSHRRLHQRWSKRFHRDLQLWVSFSLMMINSDRWQFLLLLQLHHILCFLWVPDCPYSGNRRLCCAVRSAHDVVLPCG